VFSIYVVLDLRKILLKMRDVRHIRKPFVLNNVVYFLEISMWMDIYVVFV
jgi:hypothetical protein